MDIGQSYEGRKLPVIKVRLNIIPLLLLLLLLLMV